MTNKQILMLGLVISLFSTFVGSGLFVTYQQMTAYAVSKDSMQLVLDGIDGTNKRLDKIETKLDNLANK